MKQKISPYLWVAVGLAVLLIIAIIFGVSTFTSQKLETQELKESMEELKLDNEQLRLTSEVNAINAELDGIEDQAQRLANDTILAKYNAAKTKVDQLNRELREARASKQLDKAKIAKLEGEIATLRGLLRHYVAQIDSLSKENAGLRAENQEVKAQNDNLNQQVQQVSQQNQNLNQRMQLAEKLNVTGVSLTPLKKGGKTEKNVTKAKQLMVTFTIPQNNSTPVGNKTIYMRLVNPEGAVLGNGGRFSFEGGSVQCTARKTVEYEGNEISGIRIYWDVNTTLTPGNYTVELFTDGYRLTSRTFTLKK